MEKNRYTLLVLVLCSGCGDASGTDENDPLAEQSTSAAICEQNSWASFGQSFFSKNCAACHSFAASVAQVKAKRDQIASQISKGGMPPSAKLTETDKSRALSFLACPASTGTTNVPTPDDDETPDGEALYCEACTEDVDCAGDAICVAGATEGDTFCGKPCKANKDCAVGSKCLSFNDDAGKLIAKSCYPVSGACDSGSPGPTGMTGPTGATGPSGGACTTDTWSTVSPLFTSYCSSCHSWAKTYSGVKGKKSKTRSELSSSSMPPSNKTQPSSTDRQRLIKWIDCGTPQ